MGTETNVVPDANQFNDSIDKFVRVLETIYSRDNDHSRKAALNRKCVEMLAGKKNNAAVFKTVQAKYVQDIEKQLIENKTPFITIPTGTGDVMFVTPNKYEADLLKAQENVMFTTTDYMMSCNALSIVNSAEDMGYKQVVKLDFTDKDVAMLAVQKLYQNNIPSGLVENKGDDGTVSYTLYAHPRCMYKEDGRDIISLRLDMAFEASKGTELFGGENSSYLDTRLQQAAYDSRQLEEFAKAVKSGKSVVLGDPFGKSNVYLETKNGEIMLHTRGGDNKWTERKLDVSQKASPKAIRDLCSVHADRISSMCNIPTNKWNDKFLNTTINKYDPEVKKYQSARPRVKKEDAYSHKIARTSLKELLDAVVAEASLQTKAACPDIMSTHPKDVEKAYEVKVAAIGRLLDNPEFPPLKKFLNNPDVGMTRGDKEKWLKEIKSIFLEEKEIGKMRMDLGNPKITKDFKKELANIISREMDLGNEKDGPDRE